MRICKQCGKKGFFLILKDGLCGDCFAAKAEAERKLKEEHTSNEIEGG